MALPTDGTAKGFRQQAQDFVIPGAVREYQDILVLDRGAYSGPLFNKEEF
jgi:hypothetical protein